jgi:hypothetical protein
MERLPSGPDATGAPATRWHRIACVLLVAVVVPSALVVLTIVRNPAFSRLDEYVHADYLRRIEQGEVPRVGDKVLEATVEDVQCRTVQGRRNAPCGLPEYHHDMVGAAGYQYEAQQPPLYYAVTALLRQPARLGPADDFVTTARLTGAVWLSAGLLVFFLACRRLGCRWWPTILMTLILGMGPGVLYQSATINNDAAGILTGSLALLMFASLRASASATRLAAWAAVAFALVLLKPTGLIAIAAAVVALGVDAAVDGRLTSRVAARFGVPLLAGVAMYLAWGEVRDARATVDYDVVLEALLGFKMVDDLPLDDIVAALPRLLGAYAPGGLPITPSFVAGPGSVLMLAVFAAGAAALWLPRGGEAVQRAGSVALLATLVGGPAFTLLFYIDYSVEGGPTSRYGLSLLPMLFASSACTFRTRRAMVAVAVVGALVAVPMLVANLWPTTRA